LQYFLFPSYTLHSLLIIRFLQVTPTATAQVSTTIVLEETTSIEATVVSYTTVDTTTTDIVTSTVTCFAVPTSFYLVAEGAGVDGEYVVTSQQQNQIIDTFSTNIGEATQFAIISGNLYQGTYEANTDETSIATVFFDTPGTFSGVINLACSTPVPFAGALSCSEYDGDSIFQLCPDGITCGSGIEPCGGVSIGSTVDSRCQLIQFTAVPVVPAVPVCG
jgi:hypothetical protein